LCESGPFQDRTRLPDKEGALTTDIATVFGILLVAVVLFVTEQVRVDIVALTVLVALALTNLVTPSEAMSGFANLAVITVWAVLILSGGLARTGVASVIGRQILRVAGSGEARLIAIIMLTAGVLSGFMNSIGVAALMLPVVVDIAHRKRLPPSKLLIPLAFGALLGGMTTLIGTPPNILISEALRGYGLEPFGMFDFTPTGVVVLIAGTACMVLIGRHLLPSRDFRRSMTGDSVPSAATASLGEELHVIRLPEGSPLAGRTLAGSRVGAALGLTVVGIFRRETTLLAPSPDTVLEAGDRFLVEGRLDRLDELSDRQHLVRDDSGFDAEQLVSAHLDVAEVRLPPDSHLVGQSLEESGFRQRYGAVVRGIRRGDRAFHTGLDVTVLRQGDVLLVQAPRERLEALRDEAGLIVTSIETPVQFEADERLVALRVPEGSVLAGQTLVDSRLGDAFDLGVLGIVRAGKTLPLPGPDQRLQAGDLLLAKGCRAGLETINGLQTLEVESDASLDLDALESEEVGLVEVVLSPYSALPGQTLTQLHFREKYGLSVLAIWRGGQAYRSNLRDMELRLGDALLLHGRRDRTKVLGSDPEFLVLSEEAQVPPRTKKAPIAGGIMALVLLPVIAGWLPIGVTAVAGVVLMVLTGCLTMDEAYRSIEWKAVFLIAGMLPLGIAMERTGAAAYLAQGLLALIGDMGPLIVMGGLFILASVASQVMPNPAVAVLLAPIAYNAATDMGISPLPLMMAVAISASAAFMSPVGHAANVLVMGPGSYRFSDYTKVGMPLTVAVLVVSILVVPLVWPF
jgi:di/tricarboxylate transporter